MSVSLISSLPPGQISLPLRLFTKVCEGGALLAGAFAVCAVAMQHWPLLAYSLFYGVISGGSIYYMNEFAYLKDVDVYNKELSGLNASLQLKGQEAEKLVGELAKTKQELASMQSRYTALMQADNLQQAKLNAQLEDAQQRLQNTAAALTKAQAGAEAALDQKAADLAKQVALLQKQIDADKLLTQSAEGAKKQIVNLQSSMGALQQQLDQYKLLNSSYAAQNAQLQQQIKTLTATATVGQKEIDAINHHADRLQTALDTQAQKADQINQSADQLLALLDQIDQNNKNKQGKSA